MASMTTILETMKTNHDDKLEKYKRDLSNQVKADVILSTADLETCVETIDAKVTEVESDMQCHDLDIDDLEAFKDDIVPKIDLVLTRSASSNTSPDDRNNFPRFSGYMGTRTTLQRPVPPNEYYKFVLPAGASYTSSYLDSTIPLPAGTHATDMNGNPDKNGLFALAGNLTVDIGKFQKSMSYQQLGGDDTILRKASPHLGGNNLDVHDMITNLKIEPDSDSRNSTILQVYDPFNDMWYSILMYIASQYADLRRHITQFGKHITYYPVDDIQSIHENLDTVNLDKAALYPPDSTPVSGNKAYNPSPSPQPHIARVNGNRDIPSCEYCLRRGHLADTCFARGIHFLPPDIQHHVAQYNATHGDCPKVPPKASNHPPPPVKYPPRLPHQSTVPKPNIKVLIGDLTDSNQLITDADPEIFDFMDQEDEFGDASDTLAASPSATIKQMAVNYDIMPILPDYDGMFDPAELRLLQGN
eukprot:scaffold8800_cov58-Attheya_sp.AAC.2